MTGINDDEIIKFVEENISLFHRKRLESVQALELQKLIQRKNSYLFRAKNITTAEQFVRSIVDAHLSSSEETAFGTFLEELAIFVCGRVFHGHKSSAEGIDLEFGRDGIEYIVSIKSGPNWGNSSQIKKLIDNFNKAKRIRGSGRSTTNIIAVNGCCYGRDNKPEKNENYLKLCGQPFWELISGDDDFYKKIIGPLGHMARERNEEFYVAYNKLINQFTGEFIQSFCPDGNIDWRAIVQLASSKDRYRMAKRQSSTKRLTLEDLGL
ncbi:MAG: cytosolic protein [Candidatus Lambdaproteobacteria bacterium]|nr:cytosolic protein [Candidatus Lambdaproteobacteria bacterium]